MTGHRDGRFRPPVRFWECRGAISNIMMSISARRADSASPNASLETAVVTVEPFSSIEPLSEIRGRLRKLEHSKGFLAQVFDLRCRQLCPRDLLVAWVPGKQKPPKMGEPARPPTKRPVGFLRRSLKFDKDANRSNLYIDFIWVMPEWRGQRIGKLLLCSGLKLGKDKDVRLQVAGSEDNTVAVQLYEGVGFKWFDSLKTEMLLTADKVSAAVAALTVRSLSSSASSEVETGSPDVKAEDEASTERDEDAASVVYMDPSKHVIPLLSTPAAPAA